MTATDPAVTPVRTDCPNCGAQLTQIANPDADTPPYVCGLCRLGWWCSELTADARAAWQPSTRTFRWDAIDGIQAAIAAERQQGSGS